MTPLSVILMAGVAILRIHLLLLHRAFAVAEWELHPSLTLLTQLCVGAVKVCAACYYVEIMQAPDQHNHVEICHSYTQHAQPIPSPPTTVHFHFRDFQPPIFSGCKQLEEEEEHVQIMISAQKNIGFLATSLYS